MGERVKKQDMELPAAPTCGSREFSRQSSLVFIAPTKKKAARDE